MIEPSPWLMYGGVANRLRQELLALPPQSRKENWQARRRMFVVHGYSRHVVPHFVDQPFWGRRIHALSVILRPRLTAAGLARAIQAAVTDRAMRQRAIDLAGKIRAEDGIGVAVDLIERELGR